MDRDHAPAGRRLVSGRWTESVLGGLFEAVVDGEPDADVQAAVRHLGATLDGSGVDEALLRQVLMRLVPGSSLLAMLARVNDLDGARVVVERGAARGDVTHLLAELAEDGIRPVEGGARRGQLIRSGRTRREASRA